ncbi:MAG TPA: hypothetical protein VEK05_15725, partial [Burkholderiales bacterium]|nr:hypothetical protein [Burkholderiales bacterium]
CILRYMQLLELRDHLDAQRPQQLRARSTWWQISAREDAALPKHYYADGGAGPRQNRHVWKELGEDSGEEKFE